MLFFALSGYTLYGARWFDNVPTSAEISVPDPLPVLEETSAIRISTPERGIVAVEERDVERLQLAFASFSADSLRLTKDGEPIAFYIDSADPMNEILYFYAEGVSDVMTPPPVYNLTIGNGAPMRIRDAEPTAPGVVVGMRTKRWEDNLRFFPQANGDHWLGLQIFAPATRTFELDDITPTGSVGAQLTLDLWSSSESEANPDHHIEVHLNETLLLDKYWDGIVSVTDEVELDEAMLLPSDNMLAITAFGDGVGGGESLYVDAITLEYESFLLLGNRQLTFVSDADNLMVSAAPEGTLLFDVSDSATPTLLSGMRFGSDAMSFAGSELGATFIAMKPQAAIQPTLTAMPVWETALMAEGQGADYVAIVPSIAQFEETLSPLMAHREAQGLQTQIVPLDQIYDEFAFGQATPLAIQAFLQHATSAWSPAPRFVLLVGDASYDLYNFTTVAQHNLLPAYLGLDSAENLFADDAWLTQQPDGSLNADLAIGRFPVQNRAQLATLVRKTLAYENADEDAGWRERVLLVSDDQQMYSDASMALLGPLRDDGFKPLPFDMTRNENIRDSLISALNQGVGLVNYIGEGDLEVWGDERVLRGADSADLINGTRLPILTTFTTRNGVFDDARTDTLVEQLLWADNGGIVAAIAPAGRTPMMDQLAFGELFYEGLLSGEGAEIGRILQQTRVAVTGMQPTVNLLGDPALRLNR